MSGRIRTVKPEWLEDEVLAAASDEARTLSIGLILLADDYGAGRASIATIAASVWRYQLERDDGANAPEVLAKASRAFRELLAIGFVGCWTESGQRYFAIRNWVKHQRVDKPGKRMVPEPPKTIFVARIEDSRDRRETVASDSGNTPESLAPDLDQRPTTNDLDLELGATGGAEAGAAAPPEPKPAASAARPKAVRRVRRFPDFEPKPEHVSLAMQIGADVHAEAAKFRDYEFRDPKSDPDACFRGWLRRSIELKRQAIAARGPAQGNHGKTGTENARRL